MHVSRLCTMILSALAALTSGLDFVYALDPAGAAKGFSDSCEVFMLASGPVMETSHCLTLRPISLKSIQNDCASWLAWINLPA